MDFRGTISLVHFCCIDDGKILFFNFGSLDTPYQDLIEVGRSILFPRDEYLNQGSSFEISTILWTLTTDFGNWTYFLWTLTTDFRIWLPGFNMQYRHRSRGSFCQYGSSFLWSTMLKTQPIGHTMILPCPRDHCTRRQQKRRFATQIGRNVLGKIAPQISRIAPHLTPKAACEARRLMWDGNGQEGAVCDHILVRKFFCQTKTFSKKKQSRFRNRKKSKKNKKKQKSNYIFKIIFSKLYIPNYIFKIIFSKLCIQNYIFKIIFSKLYFQHYYFRKCQPIRGLCDI